MYNWLKCVTCPLLAFDHRLITPQVTKANGFEILDEVSLTAVIDQM